MKHGVYFGDLFLATFLLITIGWRVGPEDMELFRVGPSI